MGRERPPTIARMTGRPPVAVDVLADHHEAPGHPLFASSRSEPRARRPTDIAMAIASLLAIVVTCVLANVADDLDQAFSDVLTAFPPFLDPLWLALAWTPVVWALVLLGAALVRRRPSLARDIVGGVVLAVLLAGLVGLLAGNGAWVAVTRFGDVNGPPAFPPGVLTVASAAIAVTSPHLTRPFRHFGRWLVAGQVVGATMLGTALASGSVAAIWIGLFSAAVVHVLVGSPGGRPTSSRIEVALRELGLDVVTLAPATMQTTGVVRFTGEERNGPIDVKVYGRDAWDAQLLATLWRLAWYRGSQRTARLSRVELVEHEGFMNLLAERAGVRVPQLITAGSAGQGDALVVVRPDGAPIGTDRPPLPDDALERFWTDLDRFHGAGIAHHRIDLDRVALRGDGTIGFADLSSATVAETVHDRREDEAQALALLVALAGEDRAVASARHVLGDARLLNVLPYLQLAALPNMVRDALGDAKVDLDDVRERTRTALGAEKQDLIRLRRVTAGSLLNLALLAIAAYTLIVAFGDVDLQQFWAAVQSASWWWLAFALVMAQVPRFPAAISTTGSIDVPLPLGPLTTLQFAICYVNLAIPSTAARVAINVRFFQRFGVAPTTAMTAGVIDSVSGFVVQIGIFLTLFFTSDLDLHLTTNASSTSGSATIVLIVIGAVVLVVALVALIAPLRRRVMTWVHQAASALRVLRKPSKLLRLFGGNLVHQVLFAVAFGICAEAFGVHLPLSQFLLINTVVSLFAGLLPIPGGIGVSEAGLTWGLTAAGVPSDTAFAIAIAYRICSFYLPPVWGWFCYRWLIRRHYL
jgi:glycosyltransferase 2 family protein